MTTPSGDNDIHALVLNLLGAFSNLQDYADTMVARRFFDKQIPKVADFVWKRAVSRIKDEERINLFLAIAEELDTDAELDSIKAVFMRAKRLRDNVAHSASISANGEGRLMISKTLVSSLQEPTPDPTEVERGQILAAIHDCRWVHAQMTYVMYAGNYYVKLYLGSVELEVLKPPGTPEQWDGNPFRRVGESR
ncbi:hypothetical protein [Mycobacteroides abscessus]|uniref:hypothetical protein n=1 Tax=Mycobacteroides abscessus TaxID=36809 RepID=UPI0006650FC6|nr:hypothetical protein [Mycobacteroides abscessus]AKP59815.1 hypothetical protein MAUC22_21295 [Mycobacteroides abscessus UC22]SIK42381.1 Uncharacterised protein [Mycobacteroides abscessus subsp. abscessus]SIK64263.1 Uncharacterised protein [Mycobacteroides abscessus subsp. abscessus]SIM59822.1 Uncharacterised protein [Mycobacteroides abscessus subsp. abscessus]SLC46736.1 Uncharacterised protein [Mycobacteroides abscessus subsp. abscessus]